MVEMFSRVDIPNEMLTDCGTQFTAEVMKANFITSANNDYAMAFSMLWPSSTFARNVKADFM